jgi:Rha family phage regulatory protein
MDLVKFDNGLVTASSKEIADKFGKAHRDVLRAIRQLECSDEFRERNFGLSYYTSPQNKKLKCYDITRDGFSFLGMGFTGKRAGMWKESYITAFNSMEKNLDNSGSMMEKINSAIGLMEKDKKTASLCSRGLNEWKKIKKGHEKEVNRLVDESQLVLSLRVM